MQLTERDELSERPGYLEPVPSPSLSFSQRTVAGVVRRAAAQWPADVFVKIGPDHLTFQQAYDRSSTVAGMFRALGCKKADVVALFMPTGFEIIDCYLGASQLGAISFPVNTSYQGYLLKYGLNDSGAKIVVTERSMVNKVLDIIEDLHGVEVVVVLGATDGELASMGPAGGTTRLASYESLLAASVAVAPEALPVLDAYDVNSIIYTSGTTGPSKGVLMSNAHAMNKAVSIIEICQLSKSDVIYAPIPLFHTFGLHRGLLSAMIVGLQLVVRERFSASSFWPDIQASGSTVGFCTHSMVQILKKAEPSPSDSLNSLRCLFSAPYDPEFEARFGLRLLQTFSMTEANNALFSPYFETPRAGSCGTLSPKWQVKLISDDGVEVPVGTSGEICLRPLEAGQVMLGYHRQEEATRSAFRDLWLHTGDLGKRDEDGYFYYVDRKKDAIRRRGENISSWEVERIVLGHPAIAEVAALAFPSPVGEDDVRIVMTVKPGHQQSSDLLDEIAAFCDQEMPDFMRPRYLEFRDQLPKTPTEKVLKAQLRDEGLVLHHLDRGDRNRGSMTAGAGRAR